MSEKNTGRVTIPTNLDVVPETIELMKRWGADAIRDCDGTEFPEELTKTGAKIYATYYTTRKDNAWAKANPDEVQQSYIMTNFYTATGNELQIPLMKGISDELMQVNTRDDRKRWWEVIDRSTGDADTAGFLIVFPFICGYHFPCGASAQILCRASVCERDPLYNVLPSVHTRI